MIYMHVLILNKLKHIRGIATLFFASVYMHIDICIKTQTYRNIILRTLQ